MPIFKYEIRNKKGETERGFIAGVSYDHAAKKLAALGNELVKLSEEKEGFFSRFKKVKKREIIVFTRGLATLQKAGVPMLESLNSLMEMAGKTKLRKIEQDIIMSVESGISFSAALARFPDVFEKLYVSMIQVAEASGKLDEILERLYIMYEKEEAIKSQLRGAMAYPSVVSLAITGIIFFILTFVVPNFVKTFVSMNITLPAPTQMLIKFSNFIRTQYFIYIPAVFAFFFIFKKLIKLKHIKFIFDTLSLKIPIIGGLLQKIALAHFTKELQMLLASGIPILESLKLITSTLNNDKIVNDINQMSDYISKGGSITNFIKLKKIFPLLVVQMISIGEESGALCKMLGEISVFYEDETERAIKAFLSILEPLMIVVMGLAVGAILITLMMPLFTMMKGFSI